MRITYIIFFWLLVSSCAGQNDTLLRKTEVDLVQYAQSHIDSADLLMFGHLNNINAFEIEYESDGNTVSGYLLEPKESGDFPLVIFNRGGNREFASLDPFVMIYYTSILAANGYVVLASNYRTQDQFGGEEINDVLKLIDIAPSINNVDTSRIGMFGWSRGGMMSYLAMSLTDKLKTVVVGNGPSDLEQTLIERPGLEDLVFSQCIPNYYDNKEEELKKRSVINWPEKLAKNTNLLIIAGTEDRRVSYIQAENLASKLDSIHPNFELKLFDTNHFFSDMKPLLYEELLKWFDEELKNG